MSSNDRKRGKAKKWFSKNAKKPRRAFSLGPDQKGFLLTCNFREREAIREAYQVSFVKGAIRKVLPRKVLPLLLISFDLN